MSFWRAWPKAKLLLPHRRFSTIPVSPPLLSRWPPKFSPKWDEIQVAEEAFRLSVVQKDERQLRTSYTSLLNRCEGGSIPPDLRFIDQTTLVSALDILVPSLVLSDLQFVREFISDAASVFCVPMSPDTHSRVFDSLLKAADPMLPLEWVLQGNPPLQSIPFTPSEEQWCTLVGRFSKTGDAMGILRILKHMKKFNLLSKSIEACFIHWLVAAPPALKDLFTVLTIIQRSIRRLRYLSSEYSKNPRLLAHAEMVDQFIQEQEDSSFCPVDTSQADNRNQRISARAQERGLKHALALQKSFADQGFQASPSAMSAVLSSSYSVEDLKFASKTMGIKADAYHWATLIRNAVQGGRARDAVTIYHHAKADGIRPNAIMVHPLLRALCSSKLRTPKDSDIHCALAIYRGLVPPQPDSPSSPPPSLKPTTKGSVVDVAIYNTLLRALVSSQNTEEFFPIALSLVEDMDTHNVAMDTMTTASITILLMRSAPSFSQAFDVYKRMRVLKGGGGINLEGYVAILRAFSKLPFPRKSPFSLDPYFHIIRDMRDAGHPVPREVYFVLLRELSLSAKAASGKDDNFVRDAVVGIKRIHQQLLVEGSFTPNTHDWNSLMQAYSFAGCCPEVIRIWNMIYVNGIFDSASVNIVIDACGYGGQAQLASHIWSQLLSSGFILSSHNWGTFLECLCRAGQLDEAVKRLCCEIEEPDPEHLRILLKFATPHGRGHMVKKRIKEFLPDFWKKLSPEIIRM